MALQNHKTNTNRLAGAYAANAVVDDSGHTTTIEHQIGQTEIALILADDDRVPNTYQGGVVDKGQSRVSRNFEAFSDRTEQGNQHTRELIVLRDPKPLRDAR
jgi:hypothetical protein